MASKSTDSGYIDSSTTCKANCETIKKERHEVSEQDINSYFDAIALHLQKVPSLFVWNTDETRVGSPKRRSPPEVIVAKDTQSGSVTFADERSHSQ
jgi:hypothetical protein